MGVLRCLSLAVVILLIIQACQTKEDVKDTDWPEYLGGPDRNHFSELDQISADNIKDLDVAWEYHSGDSGQIQCNPIVVNGVLYAVTATVEPFALDAATGKEIWRNRDTTGTTWYGTSRGVVYWKEKQDERILYTKESWLYALNARNGKPVLSFGDSGRVSLKAGLGPTAESKFVISNTPGTIFEDLIVMPLRVSEEADAAPGYIQAFNVRTGKLAWVFKTIPGPGEDGYETWPAEAYKNTNVGAANNWAGMAVDRERGIIYVPTGSAAFDYHGGARIGSNLYANTLLALDARTGKLRWHFQMVHHDILDRDPPAPPNLLTVTRDGKKVDAVAQVTKHGFVFLFNRETGEPLFPIKEIATPSSDIPGEQAWPTQPIPEKPLAYARQTLTENDISPFSVNREELIEKFRKARSEGPFTPLSKNGTIIFPGLDGGAEWGGAAVDPNGILYVNSSEMAWLISLNEVTRDASSSIGQGEKVYAAKCSSCHGADRKGNAASGFPSLMNLKDKYQPNQTVKIITDGKGMMPAFRSISEADRKSLLSFLYEEKEIVEKQEAETKNKKSDAAKREYKISGFTKFLDEDGYPAISPPWGTLNAIDLNTGEYVWKKVFGETPELAARGIAQTGSESYGGPVITKSGLLFIAGTKDAMFRVYRMSDGELLIEKKLPAAAFATPATYSVNGKQYIVIACGGTKLGAPKGDSYVAFALREK
jgi:quinoprotein glucose dehydrogenase